MQPIADERRLRTVARMEPTSSSLPAPATETTVEHELERELTRLGHEREYALEAGGTLWADFTDWCWVKSLQATPAHFETWLLEVRSD
jgi:hypothetical protein